MVQRRSFDKDYLKQEFDKLNTIAESPLALYLIGGGAMAFYGLKVATKDIDIILTNPEDLNSLQSALVATGYKEPNPIVITRPYNEMQTSAILENKDGFRWDLFLNKVCGKLTFSADMQKRSTPLYQGKSLKVFIASKEDLFLFKGITTRNADLDDTRILAQSGLDWETITQECKSQSQESGVCWEDALCQNLQELREKYSIQSPIERPLRKAAERKIIETMLLGQIQKGNYTVKSIAQEIKEPQSFIREDLKRLADKGLIRIDRSNKPHKFFLNEKQTSK
jgi:predicted transcriptional regulator